MNIWDCPLIKKINDMRSYIDKNVFVRQTLKNNIKSIECPIKITSPFFSASLFYVYASQVSIIKLKEPSNYLIQTTSLMAVMISHLLSLLSSLHLASFGSLGLFTHAARPISFVMFNTNWIRFRMKIHQLSCNLIGLIFQRLFQIRLQKNAKNCEIHKPKKSLLTVFLNFRFLKSSFQTFLNFCVSFTESSTLVSPKS